MEKSLDRKLARLAADSSCRDFILADAKDADMAYGVGGLGTLTHPENPRARTLDEFRGCIRDVSRQGLVDIMLMSVSTSDQLTIGERLFDDTAVTPAVRANDSTDIWLADLPSAYARQPSLPFRTASLDHAMGGVERCTDEQRKLGANLGLYSITLTNDAERDVRTLEAYADFRHEAEIKGFRHFLEVFSPNADHRLAADQIPAYVNGSIVRLLAGVAKAGRPLFLKIPYFGPAAMEALASHDSSLVVGILGGSAGTTFDAFHMVWEAKKYGARAALFGRKINNAEHQGEFVRMLRAVADDEIEPAEAVRAYHSSLLQLRVAPRRSVEDDLELSSKS
ncbi:MAG: hypothetical protein KDA61_18935 [Planctomycetales bacterium]|nr:hypothetical protein [Planctomycetales bacterium]